MTRRLRVFLVDDEELALKRLARMLKATGRAEVTGFATDPETALDLLAGQEVDAVFLDIQMPGLNGFEMLARLQDPPLVVFTTAFDQYALKAFEVSSIDYLMKPIEPDELNRALGKLERMLIAGPELDLAATLRDLKLALSGNAARPIGRIASRVGDRLQLIDPASVTHFIARDKLVYAVTADRNYSVDLTIAELERKLDAAKFIRIHRSTLLNLDYLDELHSWFGGGALARLKDPKRTELPVARDRLRALKERLGL